MCNIRKINAAIQTIEAAQNEPELIQAVKDEYGDINIDFAFIASINALKIALKRFALSPVFLYAELNTAKCKIVFIKLDGSERTAIATLSEKHGAPALEPGKEAKPGKEHLLTFYDVGKAGYRSCRIDSIKTYTRVE